MTQSQIDYALSVYSWGNFSHAARANFVSQPSLSLQIQKLEGELGFKVFERGKGKVTATEQGREFLVQAQKAQSEFRKILEYSQSRQKKLSGQVKIALIPTLSPFLLPLFLPALLKAAPDLQVEIREEKTEDCLELLRRQAIDAALIATEEDPKLYDLKLLAHEPMLLYAGKENPLLRHKSLKAQDLPTEGLWLLEEGHCLRDQVLDLCEKRRAKTSSASRVRMSSGNLQSLMALVNATQGFTLLPALAAKGLPPAQLRSFKGPQPTRPIYLARSAYQPQSLLHQKLSEILLPALKAKITVHGEKDMDPS